jgi:hypothetical protein
VKIDGSAPLLYPHTRSCTAAGPVNLEAVPASGYSFASWSGDLSGSENPTTIIMDSDKEITANFIQTQINYTLTVDAGLGGGIEVNGTAPSLYPAVYTFAEGASVNLEAVPASGYSFANWSGSLSGSENPTTITMDSDKEVTANFIQTQITYTLTVDAGPGGGIEVNGTAPSLYPATYTFAEGASVNLEAVPASGYSFVNWSGSLSSSENPTTIIMDSDKEITANFIQITYALTVDVGLSGGGTVTMEPPQPAGGYVVGTEVTLTAVASEGYKFDHWSGSFVSSESTITITMDSDKEIAANFIEVAPSTFPWWWIVVGVAVVGLLVYFLVIRGLRT